MVVVVCDGERLLCRLQAWALPCAYGFCWFAFSLRGVSSTGWWCGVRMSFFRLFAISSISGLPVEGPALGGRFEPIGAPSPTITRPRSSPTTLLLRIACCCFMLALLRFLLLGVPSILWSCWWWWPLCHLLVTQIPLALLYVVPDGVCVLFLFFLYSHFMWLYASVCMCLCRILQLTHWLCQILVDIHLALAFRRNRERYFFVGPFDFVFCVCVCGGMKKHKRAKLISCTELLNINKLWP